MADHALAASPSPAPRFPPLRRSPVQIGRACKERSLSQRLVPRGVSTGWRGQVPCLLTSSWLELHCVSTLYSFVHCLVVWNPAATVTVDKFLLSIFLVRAVTQRDALLGPSCGESSTNFPNTHPDPPSPSLLSFFSCTVIYTSDQSARILRYREGYSANIRLALMCAVVDTVRPCWACHRSMQPNLRDCVL